MSSPTLLAKEEGESSSVVVVTPVEGSVKDEGSVEATKKSNDKRKSDKAVKSNDDNSDSGSDSDSDDEEKEKVIIGVLCDTKNLYQKWDKHNRFTWTEEYPDDLEEAAENEETMKYAILVRNKKSYDSRKKLEIDSIVIQSPYLKKVLHDVLKDYPGVTTTLQRLTFTAPFRPFVHRWSQLAAALTNEAYDETTRAHLKLLHDILHAELKDVISALGDYIKNQVITYEHVWAIFQPGCTVFANRYGRPVALKLNEGEYGAHPRLGPCFMLKCDRVDYDGSKFGLDSCQQLIMPFAGTVAITELDSYPLNFNPDAELIQTMLLARGRLFEQYAGYHYKAYKGQAIEQKEWGPAKLTVESRIIIDAHAHGKSNPNEVRSLKSLTKVETARSVQQSDPDEDYGSFRRNSFDSFDFHRGQEADEELLGRQAKPTPLTEEQLILCTPMIKGYALKSKKWLEFFVDCVEEISFSEKAFESLVLPQGHKQLILAFSQSQVQYKDKFDDVISGKGKGIIMLLSGGPGIGKTLTAESVAEEMRVPLYIMSAGDLGVNSWDVEQSLNRVLEMVAKWNAVLLLDECDVFLEARTTHDLDRNRIVSIFLRTLEYYEGILFLTTNRVSNMDEAFHSRIHISLEYPPLDENARRQVWAGFLERSAGVEGSEEGNAHALTDAEVAKLAKLQINGRQIKNLLKTSNLLACNLGQDLNYEHLKTVLTVEGYKIDE